MKGKLNKLLVYCRARKIRFSRYKSLVLQGEKARFKMLSSLVLQGEKGKVQKVVQMSWTFVNDSLCTTLCLQVCIVYCIVCDSLKKDFLARSLFFCFQIFFSILCIVSEA